MTSLRLLMFAAVCFITTASLLAQTATAPSGLATGTTFGSSAQRDLRAIAILQTALGSLGGPVMANPSIVATGNVQFSRAVNASGSFTWKRAGREFRYENPDGSILVSGSGKPARNAAGTWKRLSGTQLLSDFPAHLPGLVIARVLADSRYEIRLVGTRDLNGRSTDVVSVARVYPDDTDGFLAALTRRTFYFDSSSNALVRVEYEISDDVYAGSRAPIAVDYQQFTPLGGVNSPVRFTISLQGELFATYTIETVNQTAIAAQEFAGGAQ